jgi:hypothetical protein
MIAFQRRKLQLEKKGSACFAPAIPAAISQLHHCPILPAKTRTFVSFFHVFVSSLS